MPFLAIDIGGTKTATALIDDDVIIDHASWTSPNNAESAIEQIITNCSILAPKATSCGVSFGGPFDFATQTCVRSMHVPGWEGIALSERLQEALGICVLTDNDANVGALGEYQRTPARERDPLLYVTISTGVGAAIVTGSDDGLPRLLRGAHSLAGELGHLPIGHDKPCNCGQLGCLERAVSGYWIERDHGKTAQEVLADEELHYRWIQDLAIGLWSAIMLIDPAVVVIGGGMSLQGDRLLDPLINALANRARGSHRSMPGIQLGDPSGRTVLAGAAILAKGIDRGSC